MRLSEAELRRNFWLRAAGGPCEHPVAALEETEKGYLTGRYICTTCGAIFERIDVSQPCTAERELV